MPKKKLTGLLPSNTWKKAFPLGQIFKDGRTKRTCGNLDARGNLQKLLGAAVKWPNFKKTSWASELRGRLCKKQQVKNLVAAVALFLVKGLSLWQGETRKPTSWRRVGKVSLQYFILSCLYITQHVLSNFSPSRCVPQALYTVTVVTQHNSFYSQIEKSRPEDHSTRRPQDQRTTAPEGRKTSGPKEQRSTRGDKKTTGPDDHRTRRRNL